ncbi:MAG: hypothetical protein ABS86_01145 [Sphingobium sp. SCN 64-10]|nr:MAG: hypothetical protein ABS86_01145 [Sphingobium sp. SCN 64-10]
MADRCRFLKKHRHDRHLIQHYWRRQKQCRSHDSSAQLITFRQEELTWALQVHRLWAILCE